MVKKDASAEQHAQARAVAAKIRDAVANATSAKQFKAHAKAVPRDGVKVRIENLAPVTADGRVVSSRWPPATFASEFAQAAHALRQVGDISPVVKTPFGYHVIFLVERVPEKRVPHAQRVEALRDAIYEERGVEQLKRLLEDRQQSIGVSVELSAPELMRQVEVEE
jgi:hypothetical protein